MRKGFDAALALKEGRTEVRFQALGLARPAQPEPLSLRAESVGEALGKVFAVNPALRDIALEPLPSEEEAGLWLEPKTLWRLRPRFAVLWEGRDVRYLTGLATPLAEGGTLTLLPPGRRGGPGAPGHVVAWPGMGPGRNSSSSVPSWPWGPSA